MNTATHEERMAAIARTRATAEQAARVASGTSVGGYLSEWTGDLSYRFEETDRNLPVRDYATKIIWSGLYRQRKVSTGRLARGTRDFCICDEWVNEADRPVWGNQS